MSQNILNSLPSVVLLTGARGALQGGRSGSGPLGSAWWGQRVSRATGSVGAEGGVEQAPWLGYLRPEGSRSSAFHDETSAKALGGARWRTVGLAQALLRPGLPPLPQEHWGSGVPVGWDWELSLAFRGDLLAV